MEKRIDLFLFIAIILFVPIFGVVYTLNIKSPSIFNQTTNINERKLEDEEITPDDFNSNLNTASKRVNISTVPYYDQIVYYWCGPACLQMVYDYYGENISQLEICDVARTEPNEVTWECDMRRATHFSNLSTSVGNEMYPENITGYSNRIYGYITFEQQFKNASDLRYMIDAGHPIIVL